MSIARVTHPHNEAAGGETGFAAGGPADFSTPQKESVGMSPVQKALILAGAALIALGVLWPAIAKLGLGRLPGDIRIERDGFSFYFPITTMILLSIAVSLVLRWLRK